MKEPRPAEGGNGRPGLLALVLDLVLLVNLQAGQVGLLAVDPQLGLVHVASEANCWVLPSAASLRIDSRPSSSASSSSRSWSASSVTSACQVTRASMVSMSPESSSFWTSSRLRIVVCFGITVPLVVVVSDLGRNLGQMLSPARRSFQRV